MAMLTMLRRLRARWRYRAFDRELGEELATHRAMVEDHPSMADEEVRERRRKSAVRMGSTAIAREDARAVWMPPIWSQLLQDTRYALRAIRRTPGFTLAAVSMLTLGLGLVSGGFVFLNGLFFRSWNVPDAGRVFVVKTRDPRPGGSQGTRDGLSIGTYEHVSAGGRAAAYSAMAPIHVRVAADGGKGGTYVNGYAVSPNFVETLEIPLQRGRGLLDSRDTSASRVLISDRLWRRTFNADSAIVGRGVWIDGQPAVVAAVLSPEFDGFGPSHLDVFAELTHVTKLADGTLDTLAKDKTGCCLEIAGRMGPASDRAAVAAEVQGLVTQYRQSLGLPGLMTAVIGTTAAEAILDDQRGSTVMAAFSLVAAGFVLVLILTCANVGNLYLARSVRRRGEIAVRLAIGASRGRVLRQLLTEGGVLAVMAGAGALAAAVATPRVIMAIDSSTNAGLFAVDWHVVIFAATLTAVAALAISLAPAITITKSALPGRTRTITPETRRTRAWLLAVQIALAAVLVMSAALLSRSIAATLSAPADYAMDTTMFVWIGEGNLTVDRPEAAARVARDARAALVSRAADLVGLVNAGMGAGGLSGARTSVQRSDDQLEIGVIELPMTSSALSLLDVPLVQGRMTSDDPAAAEIVVNQSLARALSRESVLGTTIRLRRDARTYTIVGVVRDTHLTSIAEVPPIVHPTASPELPMMSVLARSGEGAQARITAIVQATSPASTVTFTPLSEVRTNAIVRAAVGASVAAGLSAIALMVAAVGLVSAFAYLVEERRREIGIRLALGATRAQVRRSMFRATGHALTRGLALGLALSVAAGLLLQRFLFGVSPFDPLSYIAALVALSLTALGAAAVPVRRAMRVDPAVTLRAD